MNCFIPGPNIKILSRLINGLSKIGDDIYLEATKDYLSLKSVNMTTTAYCTINLQDSFFSTYELNVNEELVCKIPMKGVLSVFKSHGHKDKKPEFCKIELEDNATKIIFKFRYKHDVNDVRSLYLSDGQSVNVVYNKDNQTNYIGASAQLFTQVLSNFQSHDDDMSLEVTSHKALIRNYITGDATVTKSIRSQLTLTAGEFSSFKINQDTAITFSLKPFRAAVSLAEIMNLGLVLNFETPGRPAFVEIRNTMYEISFLIATLKSDDISSTLSTATKIPKAKQQNNPKVLNDINWDDFDNAIDAATEKSILENLDTDATMEKSNHDNLDIDVVSKSPSNKRIRSIFGRCYEETFRPQTANLGDVLAPNSDSDSE